ncbi:MAG: hypothetical protein ABEK12_02895 [Candidatus Nanohaloarchaea archaeon]
MILYGAFLLNAGAWDGREMKAVFTAFFGALMVYRLAALGVAGGVTVGVLREAALLLPAVFAGSWIGIGIFDRVPERTFTWLVLLGLSATAVLLVATAI